MARCSVVWPSSAERGEHVGLGLPILGLQLRAQILVERRGRDGVEQGEDFEFSFHAVLLGAFEFAGEQMIHHQRRDVGGDLQVLLGDRRPLM